MTNASQYSYIQQISSFIYYFPVFELADSHSSVVTDRYIERITDRLQAPRESTLDFPAEHSWNGSHGVTKTTLPIPKEPTVLLDSALGGSHSYAENNQCYMYHCFWKDDRSCVNHPRHHVGVLDRLLSMLTCLQVELSRCAWRVSMAKVSTPCPNRGAST